MSKRVDTSGIVPDFVITQAKSSNREQKSDPMLLHVETAPVEVQQPEPEVPVTESVRELEPVRDEPRRRKPKPLADQQDYRTLFIHEAAITARSGKTVYISKEHHDRITKILQVIGKNEVSLFSYIYNVLEHHFSSFQEDMNELYESNLERKVF